MTREGKKDNWSRLREALHTTRQMGFRTPLDRVYQAERPQCGATCRAGHPCQAPAMLDRETGCYIRNGRCRRHGGLSTGARTPEGRERIAAAARLRWQRHREGQIGTP